MVKRLGSRSDPVTFCVKLNIYFLNNLITASVLVEKHMVLHEIQQLGYLNSNLMLTLARTVATPPPLRFFADSEKTAARRNAGSWATLWGKPCAIFGKKKMTGSGQVTEL